MYKHEYEYKYKYNYNYNTRGSKTCTAYGNSVQKAYDRACLIKTAGGAAIETKNGYHIGADFRVD